MVYKEITVTSGTVVLLQKQSNGKSILLICLQFACF